MTGTKFLFAASTGGHLAQLVRLAPRFSPSEDSLWVTFRSPQSESLLYGKRVVWVPYVRPRDAVTAFRVSRTIARMVRNEHFDRAISTGAALAVAVLPVAKRAGVPTTYVESVSRVDGPSLSGRMIEGLRAADLYTQHASWANARWQPFDGVLAEFHAENRKPPVAEPSLFVTLGTIEGYRFDSLVDAVLDTGLANESTVWQLGWTPRQDLPGRVSDQMPAAAFEAAAREADLVVTHAGVGTILQLLDWGIYPVVVPRRKASKEHVDDHQNQIAQLVDNLGIGRRLLPDDINASELIRATSRSVRPAVAGFAQ